jgi:hypothetical protein
VVMGHVPVIVRVHLTGMLVLMFGVAHDLLSCLNSQMPTSYDALVRPS